MRADLREAILVLLRPEGLRQRLRPPRRTVKQIWSALPEELRPPAEGAGVAREQRSLEQLRGVLATMVQAGELRRDVVRQRVFLNTKGKRLALVDLYRLA